MSSSNAAQVNDDWNRFVLGQDDTVQGMSQVIWRMLQMRTGTLLLTGEPVLANSAVETAGHCPTPTLGLKEGKRQRLKANLLIQKSLPGTVHIFHFFLPPWVFQPRGECTTAWVTSSSTDWLRKAYPFISSAWRPFLQADSTSRTLYWSFADRVEMGKTDSCQDST